MLATALLLALAPALAPAALSDVPVGWRGKSFTLKTLPADLPDPARRAIETWSAAAGDLGYRIEVADDARIVVAYPAEKSRPDRELALVAGTQRWFDRLVGSPAAVVGASAPRPPGDAGKGGEKAADKGATKAKARSSGDIPEDPEGPPVGLGAAPVPATRGAGEVRAQAPRGSQVAALFLLANEADLGLLLDRIAKEHPLFAEWAGKARSQVGFVLPEPLCGAFVAEAAGQEEWSPEHEIVHRSAQLAILGAFDQLPYWLTVGLAWEAEIAHDGTVWCFPFRDEFVFTAEHGAWPNEVKRALADRGKAPFPLAEAAALRRGTWNGSAAQLAWGFAHYLARQQPGKLAEVFREMHRHWDAENRRPTGPSTWERDTEWESPLEDQQAILERVLGDDVLEQAAAFLSTLKRPSSEKTSARDRRG